MDSKEKLIEHFSGMIRFEEDMRLAYDKLIKSVSDQLITAKLSMIRTEEAYHIQLARELVEVLKEHL
jgi:hypothetical protein